MEKWKWEFDEEMTRAECRLSDGTHAVIECRAEYPGDEAWCWWLTIPGDMKGDYRFFSVEDDLIKAQYQAHSRYRNFQQKRASEQPAPKKNDYPAIWDLVTEDIRKRDKEGEQKYGTRLQPHNGRDVLRDAYEEAMDMTVYLRQAIYERDGR